MKKVLVGVLVGAALSGVSTFLVLKAQRPMSPVEVGEKLRELRGLDKLVQYETEEWWPFSLPAYVEEHKLDDAICAMAAAGSSEMLTRFVYESYANPNLGRVYEPSTAEYCLADAFLGRWAAGDQQINVGRFEAAALLMRALEYWVEPDKHVQTDADLERLGSWLHMASRRPISWRKVKGNAGWDRVSAVYDQYVPPDRRE